MSDSISSIKGLSPVLVPVVPVDRKVPNQTNSINVLEKTPQKDEFKKDGMSTTTKVAIATTLGLGVALTADFVFFKGKYSKKVVNYIKNLFKKPTQKPSTSTNNTVTTISKPTQKPTNVSLTNNNSYIDTRHVNADTRKLVEQAQRDIVTPQQQALYNQRHSYQPPTLQQRQAMDRLHQANQAQRAELNSIKNNSIGAEKLEQVATNIQKENIALNKIGTNTIKHANGNVYHIKDGKVVKVDLYNHCKDGTLKFNHSLDSELKIAKHLSKQGVTFA